MLFPRSQPAWAEVCDFRYAEMEVRSVNVDQQGNPILFRAFLKGFFKVFLGIF